MPANYYSEACVCRRGHVYVTDTSRMPPSDHCETCGAMLITHCVDCDEALRGLSAPPGKMVAYKSPYDPPSFCFNCGGPFPWASRQARLWELENRLDEEAGLTEADRLTIHEQLEDLRSGELSDEEATERWQRLHDVAPGALAKAVKVVETVATAYTMKKLGLVT
ncbi:MAG: DUF2321 domain-containing protein [Acidimicrobiales bacterium]|nr:DUF2321 domain-containing protein [Acidimicrobiales bacterium]